MKSLNPLYLILLSMFIHSCNDSKKGKGENLGENSHAMVDVKDTHAVNTNATSNSIRYENKTLKPVSVLVLPTRCDYEFQLMGFEFASLIRTQLSNETTFDVPEFPYKILQGTYYNCVYDTIGCKRILKRARFDYIIMSKYTEGDDFIRPMPTDSSEITYWGYEIKVLDVKTMKTYIAIKGQKLKSFADLESDIKAKIPTIIQMIKASEDSLKN